MNIRSVISSILFLLLIAVAPARPQSTQPGAHAKFDPTRDPAKDLKEAIVEAQKTDRRILLDVGGEWCIWCHRLDSLYIRNPDLDKYLNDHYVVVKVNVSKENKNEAFLTQYPKVPGYPHLFVLDTDGKFLHSQDTGVLESGKGHDPAKVLAFLQKWAKPTQQQ